MPLLLADHVGNAADHGDIDNTVCRVGGGLDEDDGHPAFRHRSLCGGYHRGLADTIGETHRRNAEIVEGLCQQRLSAAVQRLGMEYGVAGPDESEKRRRNGGHAGREERTTLGAFVNGKAVLDDLAIGMVETRIDEACTSACGRLLAAGDIVEEVATVFRRLEDEGRGQKHRRLHRAFRQFRIVAVIEHLGFRMESVVADMGFRRMRCSHLRKVLLNRR
ncbi:hypothetical protein D3C87_1460290 [compost metagenome]